MDAGLVRGESFAIDASVMEADASRYHGKAPDEIDWSAPELQTRAVVEFLTAIDDNDADADRKLPKVISPTDPCSAWTAKANKRVQFGYGLNYVIDTAHAVIVDGGIPLNFTHKGLAIGFGCLSSPITVFPGGQQGNVACCCTSPVEDVRSPMSFHRNEGCWSAPPPTSQRADRHSRLCGSSPRRHVPGHRATVASRPTPRKNRWPVLRPE
jgi:hypothetical protein